MKNGTQSFVQSLLAALPFTNKGKDTKTVLKRVNRPTFFVTEKERVNEIQTLVDQGKHRLALKQLVKDTNVENPIQYYNNIRKGEPVECMSGMNKSRQTSPSNASEINNEQPQESTDNADICQWTGYTRKFDQLVCSNNVFKHPWKSTTSVIGQREAAKSDICAYHQKYCIDESKGHGTQMIRIAIPNKFALCLECHILKVGAPPVALSRYPGQRRKYTLEDRQLHESKLIIENNGEQHVEPKSDTIINVTYTAHAPRISQTVAAMIIVQTFRNILARVREVKKYKLERLQNRAAVQIQSFFRYCRIRENSRKNELQTLQDIKNEACREDKIANNAPKPMIADLITPPIVSKSALAMDQCHPCNSPGVSSSLFLRGVDRRRQKIGLKCDASACQLCHERKKVQPSGRSQTRSFRAENLPNLIGEIHNLQKSFKRMDRFDLGNLPRNQMLKILESFWKKVGQPMLPQEMQSIINAFECRDGIDGHIDYTKYLRFASRQSYPCSIHSRIVCPNEKCIKRSRCTTIKRCSKFIEDPLDPSFCQCGKYKARHEPLPLAESPQLRKRGFNVFSSNDLKRAFGRTTNPDTNIDVEFVYLNALHQRNSSQQLSGPKTTLPKASLQMQVSSKSPSHVLKSTSPSSTFENAAAAKKDQKKKSINEKFIAKNLARANESSITFSPKRLASMMDQCVQYRKFPSQPKPTTPCPLCKLEFFDVELLQNHLTRRHTRQEIDYTYHLQTNNFDHNRDQMKFHVEWVGKFKVVPPLPSPVPLKICYHHVPPHPKCALCRDASTASPLFPPIHFYDAAFTERRTLVQTKDNACDGDEEEKVEVIQNFHFNLEDQDLAVIFQEEAHGRIEAGHPVALCEDGRCNYYVGVQCYSHSHSHLNVNSTDEWVMESEVKFVEMTRVIGRRHVFHCDEVEFAKKKQEMRTVTTSASKTMEDGIKYCKFMRKGDALIPVPIHSYCRLFPSLSNVS